jgi:hypothetical protein
VQRRDRGRGTDAGEEEKREGEEERERERRDEVHLERSEMCYQEHPCHLQGSFVF